MCNCVDKINSEFIVGRVTPATENGKESKNNHKIAQKEEWNFYPPPPLDLFDQVQICSGLDLVSHPSLRRWTEFGVDCTFVTQSASISLVLSHLEKSHFWPRAPLLQEERFQLDVSRFTSRAHALHHTQRCRGITTQDLLCRLIRLLGIASKLQ